MRLNHKSGGPAFPHKTMLTESGQVTAQPGMTLRDYFAAKAMQSMASTGNTNPNTIAPYAEAAYHWADAMIKARAKTGGAA